MALLNNPVTLGIVGTVFGLTSRIHLHRPDRAPSGPGAVLLCCNHLSHYDPVCISALSRRRIDWLARVEFTQTPLSAWLLRRSDAIVIDRYGAALPGIRESLRRLGAGRRVGVYPEGGVTRGEASVLRGGKVKEGLALLSIHSRAPVVPCVMLGSGQFGSVVRWLPLRSGNLWLGFGPALEPEPGWTRGRQARGIFTRRIEAAMQALYREMLEAYELPESSRP